jgi:hypothetical protein
VPLEDQVGEERPAPDRPVDDGAPRSRVPETEPPPPADDGGDDERRRP